MNILKSITTVLIAMAILSSYSLATGNISIVGKNGDISSKTITAEKKVKRVNPLSILSIIGDRRSRQTKKIDIQVKKNTLEKNSINKKSVNKKSKKRKRENKKDKKRKIKFKKNSRKYSKQKVDRSRKKIIYLTFDDGPLRGTDSVLNILKSEDVVATMFFIGKHVQQREKLYNKAVSMSNILVANHTYSHANNKYAKFYRNEINVLDDIDKAQRIIGGAKYLRLAGRNVWRLPEINRNDSSIKKKQGDIETRVYDDLKSRGYFIYGWDTEWRYDHSTGKPLFGAQEMLNTLERLHNKNRSEKTGKIILLAHGFMFRSKSQASKLRELIRELKYNGWSFDTIDNYSSTTPGVFAKNKPINMERIKNKQITLDVLSASNDKKLELETKLNDAIDKYASTEVKKLIDMGANPNMIDAKGRLALNTAVKVNSLAIVRSLIEKGAKITNYDALGKTPIATAEQYKHKRIRMYLEIKLNKPSSNLALLR